MILQSVPGAYGYSVLTHQAIVDTAWNDTFVPLLKARYPATTPEQLLGAHAYAYGGAIVQDMGYYPFSSRFFSDLVHYVRSGDFVVTLLRDAQDVNEYAFALGALAHYAADNSGHPEAVNRAVPMLYPKLQRKFGDVVTYEDDPASHIRAEFGFDVLEVARGNYAPKAYHDFIGFQVSKPLLERSLEGAYCLPVKEVFKNIDLALGTYRRTVSGLIPEMTKAAWSARKNDILKSTPGVTRRKFVYNISRASFEKEWGNQYERPGPGAKVLAFFMRILPKVGPLKALAFKLPSPEAEKLFMRSFNDTLTKFRGLAAQARTGKLQLPDRNLDTGEPVVEGTYRMADETYGKLLEKLADGKIQPSPELRQTILTFYKHPDPKMSTKARGELAQLAGGRN